MLRAAAKNFHDVTVICDKNDYARVQKEMENGQVSLELKRELAGKVFNLMSAYDGAVAQFLLKKPFPEYLSLSYRKKQDLRYGENPHQTGCFYGNTTLDGAMNTFEVLNGKELSYNNFKDVDIA
jgi:phosphoribosylaminoimidazolecarboxamide formyltransferase/IMP cyclohydrolase